MIKNGKIWPIIIAVSIFGVVLLSYWTIKETAKADLTQSNLYMSDYHHVDDNINEIIQEKIIFDKYYTITLESLQFADGKWNIAYKLQTKDAKPVDNAKLELVLSRPINDAKDIVLQPTLVKDGLYIYKDIELPKVGRWDLILKVEIGDKKRYYNLKADTRSQKVFEF